VDLAFLSIISLPVPLHEKFSEAALPALKSAAGSAIAITHRKPPLTAPVSLNCFDSSFSCTISFLRPSFATGGTSRRKTSALFVANFSRNQSIHQFVQCFRYRAFLDRFARRRARALQIVESTCDKLWPFETRAAFSARAANSRDHRQHAGIIGRVFFARNVRAFLWQPGKRARNIGKKHLGFHRDSSQDRENNDNHVRLLGPHGFDGIILNCAFPSLQLPPQSEAFSTARLLCQRAAFPTDRSSYSYSDLGPESGSAFPGQPEYAQPMPFPCRSQFRHKSWTALRDVEKGERSSGDGISGHKVTISINGVPARLEIDSRGRFEMGTLATSSRDECEPGAISCPGPMFSVRLRVKGQIM